MTFPTSFLDIFSVGRVSVMESLQNLIAGKKPETARQSTNLLIAAEYYFLIGVINETDFRIIKESLNNRRLCAAKTREGNFCRHLAVTQDKLGVGIRLCRLHENRLKTIWVHTNEYIFIPDLILLMIEFLNPLGNFY